MEQPEYHIVPSSVVSEAIKTSHNKWLNTPGKHGQPHNDNPIRTFSDADNTYKDRWDLLG